MRHHTVSKDKNRDGQAGLNATCDMKLLRDLRGSGGHHRRGYRGNEREARNDEGRGPFLLLGPTVRVRFSCLSETRVLI